MNADETAVLLSYPRSGNTWLRYILEAFTGRPTLGNPDSPVEDTPIHTRLDGLAVAAAAVPAAVKRHERRQLRPEDAQRRLVVVVRDYKECIVRHRYHLEERGQPFSFERESRLYLAPMVYYEEHPAAKLLLFYEDLVERPEAEISRLGVFFGIDAAARQAFLADYDAHRARSLAAYPSHTQGTTTRYHALQLTLAERRRWDDALHRLDPVRYARYLARYREPD